MPASIYPPCHHPAWPKTCPRCGKQCDGTAINIPCDTPTRLRFDLRYAVGQTAIQYTGSYCDPCGVLVMELPEHLDSADRHAIRAAMQRTHYFAPGAAYEEMIIAPVE